MSERISLHGLVNVDSPGRLKEKTINNISGVESVVV